MAEEIATAMQATLVPHPSLMTFKHPFPLGLMEADDVTNWKLVRTFSKYSTLLQDLSEALGVSLTTNFPTRSIERILDYSAFVRNFAALKSYTVGTFWDNIHGIFFQHLDTYYFLPQCGHYILQYFGEITESDIRARTPNTDGSAGSKIYFAADSYLVVDGGGSFAIVQDMLYFEGKSAKGMTWDERRKDSFWPFKVGKSNTGLFVSTKWFASHDIEGVKKFALKFAQQSMFGAIQFVHKGPHMLGQRDDKSFVWYNMPPTIMVRLWNSKETDLGWEFSMLCRRDVREGDTAGVKDEEFIDGHKILIPFDIASAANINDGQIVHVEFKPDERAAPPAGPAPGGKGKGGSAAPPPVSATAAIAGSFEYKKRRPDLLWPNTQSELLSRMQWKKWDAAPKCATLLKEKEKYPDEPEELIEG